MQLLDEAELAGPVWDLQVDPSRYFADAGQLFLRSSFDSDASFLCFDATLWGGAHCHLSRNAVSLYHGGRMLLCDPGIFSYEMANPYAIYGKSTPAHNTINFEGLSQSEAMGGRTPAPQLILEAESKGATASMTTLLLPFSADVPEIEISRFSFAVGAAQGHILDWKDGSRDIVAAAPGLRKQIGEAGEIETDATLAVVSLKNGQPWRVILIGGMYLEYRGRLIAAMPVAGNYRLDV